MSEPPPLSLTTRDGTRRLPREIEIWFTRHEGRDSLVAEHCARAQWRQNVLGEPRVRARVGQRRIAARARVAGARQEPGLAREVRVRSEDKYGRGDGLVVEIASGGRPRPRG